jgi:hypothetical protein
LPFQPGRKDAAVFRHSVFANDCAPGTQASS